MCRFAYVMYGERKVEPEVGGKGEGLKSALANMQ